METKTTRSPLHFFMWDQYLDSLNKMWEHKSQKTEDETTQGAQYFQQILWNRHLLSLNKSWHVPPTLNLSPSTSLTGKLLSPIKKLLIRWIQPSIDVLIQKQNDVNAQIVQSLNGFAESIDYEIMGKLDSQQKFNAHLVQTLNGLIEAFDSEPNSITQELQQIVKAIQQKSETLEIDRILLHKKVDARFNSLNDGVTNPEELPRVTSPITAQQDDCSYALFENIYRGDEAMIKDWQQEYVQYFQACQNVLDIGCGRGEFLELLRDHNIIGCGVDMNQIMIERCRQKGLNVEKANIFHYLASLDNDSLDGIFCAQMVEHCSSATLSQLFSLCFDKLQPDKYIIVETQNPGSLYALANFYRDMSHEKPVHPDALHHVLKNSGFRHIQVQYKAPFSKELQLQEIDAQMLQHDKRQALSEVLNKNIRQLNDFLYGYLDYALIAQK